MVRTSGPELPTPPHFPTPPPPRNQKPPPQPQTGVPTATSFHIVNDIISKRKRASYGYDVEQSTSPKGFSHNRQPINDPYGQDGRRAKQNPKAADNVQEPTFEPTEDPFLTKMRAVLAEHVQQISELRQENDALIERLNTVLTATWDFGQEEWHGHPHRPKHAELCLMTRERKEATWMVPFDFESPMKQKVEVEPDTFPLRDAWAIEEEEEDDADQEEHKATPPNHVGARRSIGWDIQFEAESEVSTQTVTVGQGEGCLGNVIMHPSSSKRLAWDIVGMNLLIYDVIMVPIGAFSPKDNVFTIFMDWCTLLFWSCDMVATCLTGFNAKGITIMEPRRIFMNYLWTWFFLDIVIVVPDWTLTIFNLMDDQSSSSGSFTRLLRSFRMARALRLLRLAKLKRILTMVKDLIQSELVFKAVNVVQIVTMLLFANHLICSVWYLVGTNSDQNWIDSARIQNEPLSYRYFTSLQWSLSFFTLGSIRVEPQNSFERFFAIVLMTFGMLFFISFTSYVTVALLQSRDNRKDISTQLWLLRRYLRQQRVSAMLAYRVLRSAEYACRSQKEVLQEKSVSVLEVVPDGLRTELRYEAYFSALGRHPLFELALSISHKTVHGLANNVMTRRNLAGKEALFKRGIWCPHMYVIASGELFYAQTLDRTFKLSVGQWACEHTLWVRWMSRGIAKASKNECSVIQVEERLFAEAVQQDDELHTMMLAYAANFAEYLNSVDPVQLLDIFPNEEAMRRAHAFLADCK